MAPVAMAMAACSTDRLGLRLDTTIPVDSTIPAPTVPVPSSPVATAYPTVPPVTAPPPAWVPPGWTNEQVTAFLAEADAALKGLGAEPSLHPNAGTATLDNGTTVDLGAIASQLAGTDPTSWPKAIANYVMAALSPGQGDIGGTWTQVKPLIRVRVGALSSFDTPANRLVAHTVTGDLVVAAMLDRNGVSTLVTPNQVQLWGQTVDSVVAVGLDQTLGRKLVPQSNGPYVTVLGDQYASSWILDPSAIIRPPQPGGYVVAIPSTDQFLALIVDRALSQDKLNSMATRAVDDFNASASPASPDLYWWHDGVFTALTTSGGQLQVPADLWTAVARA